MKYVDQDNFMHNYLHNNFKEIIDCCYTSNYDDEYSKLFPTISKTDVKKISRYPDFEYKELLGKLQAKFNLNTVVLSSGIEDAILRLNEYFGRIKSNIVIVCPIFHRVIETCVVEYKIISPSNLFSQDLRQFNVIWLQNPNLFSGNIYNAKKLLSLIKNKPYTVFVIDESAIFTLEKWHSFSLVQHTKSILNIIVLNSFSKMHGLSGMRAGFMSGNCEILSAIKKRETTFPYTSLTIEYVQSVLSRQSEKLLKKIRQRIEIHKQELIKLICSSKKISVSSTVANCIFVESKLVNLYKTFLDFGILTLDMSDKDKSRVRITIHSSVKIHKKLYSSVQRILKRIEL